MQKTYHHRITNPWLFQSQKWHFLAFSSKKPYIFLRNLVNILVIHFYSEWGYPWNESPTKFERQQVAPLSLWWPILVMMFNMTCIIWWYSSVTKSMIPFCNENSASPNLSLLIHCCDTVSVIHSADTVIRFLLSKFTFFALGDTL